MLQHLLVALFRVFRLVDAHNFNLRELMQTVQSTHVLAVAAGLAAEALCVCAVLDRQLCLVKNHVAVDIGDRNLGGGDEVEVVHLAVIHLSLLVRQLSRAVA